VSAIKRWFTDGYGLSYRGLFTIIGGALALIAGVIIAIVVATDGPPTGWVEAKRFTPAHMIWTTQCQTVGKTTVCHPQPIYVGDEWELQLRNKDDVGWRDVDQSTYDRWQVGQFYPGPGKS